MPRTVYILVAQSNESHPFSIRTWADNGAMTMTALLAGDLAARKVPYGSCGKASTRVARPSTAHTFHIDPTHAVCGTVQAKDAIVQGIIIRQKTR